tara:strand:- start:538 stop:1380 length:843 start_codon:yes stop_codon:yes gene_type:complete
MITTIGIGNAGSNIARKFKENKEYKVYCLSNEADKTNKLEYGLESFDNQEDYEENIPNLSKFFKEVTKNVQVFVCGSSKSANYTLGILQQIKDKKIDLFYIKPDTDLLIGNLKLQEKAIFGILQEYARSGLFNSITIFSNPILEQTIGNVPIKKYFETINQTIYYSVHYKNLFEHTSPIIGNLSDPSEVQRIRALGRLDTNKVQENWFYELDMGRDVCYYFCISKEKLEQDGGLHQRIVEKLKQKSTNAFKNLTYAIYESPYETDFGFCVAHTNAIQNNP